MSSSSGRRAGRLAGDRRGTVAVEFAFVGLSFVILLLGAVDLARYQIVRQSLGSIAEEGARQALITSSAGSVAGGGCGTAITAAQLKTAVTTPTNPTPMLTLANLTLTPACSGTGVRTVTVTASYPFTFVAPLLPTLSSMTASATLYY